MTKSKIWLLALLLVPLDAAHSQCAPGVPSAGNPGCIPANQPNSPYYRDDASGLVVQQPQPRWESRWGAIAVDLKLAKGGTAVDQDSESAASRGSLDRCASNGGTSCEVIQVFKNQCAAVVQPTGGGPLSTATAATAEEAVSRALNRCGEGDRCLMIFKECSLPARID
ncbi:DUF4189 domain-containing protein [Luteibacter sp.]|uniref:DUF4189 domain-containing protein n=1 Tax=Luteibacter sp. TaxID=1886636 RepID=UPI003F7E30FD